MSFLLQLQLDYTYDGRDLITQILETDDLGLTSTVSFTYDSRGRLIAETACQEDSDCGAAATAGWYAGKRIDYAIGKVTGKKLSTRIGEWMYRTCPWCFDLAGRACGRCGGVMP